MPVSAGGAAGFPPGHPKGHLRSMTFFHRLVGRFFRGIEGWGGAPDRERLLDVTSGLCPRCGQERIRMLDVRVDDLGYSVRRRERRVCGCDAGPGESSARPDPSRAP